MLSIDRVKIVLRNILYLISGNAATLVLGFAFNIYIAKILGAAEYGIYNTVGAFTAMFGVFVFQGYQKVAIRECSGNKENLKKVIENIIGIKTALSLFSVISAIIFSFFFNYSDLIIIYISIFSFNNLFGSISSMAEVVYHVNSKMKYIAYTSIIQKLVYILPAGICIWFNGGVKYLIIFYTVSNFINIFINLFIIKKFFSITIALNSLFTCKIDAKRFKEAFVFTLLGFIGYFHIRIDITMLSWMMAVESVGFYSAASKLIMPIHMAGRMVKVALFPHFMEIFKGQNKIHASQLFKVTGIIAICVIPVSGMISVFSEQIIFYTFGVEYSESANVLKILSWVIPLGIVGLPFTISMQANHHEKKMILPNVLRALSNVILNYFCIQKYGLMGAVYSTIIVYFWFHIIITFGYQYYVLKKENNIV